MENYLLEGEKMLQHSPNNIVVLTTHRIRYHATNSSHAHLVSMMLEKVSSCEMRYQSSPLMLVLGIIAALFGAFSMTQRFGGSEVGVLMMLIGAVLIIAYFVTRKHIVSIASDGGARIGFETKGMKADAVVTLINNIEQAKYARMTSLHQTANTVFA